MRADLVGAKSFAQLMRYPLYETARVDKNKGGTMSINLPDYFLVNRRPDILPDYRPQFFIRHFDAEIQIPLMTGVYYFALR